MPPKASNPARQKGPVFKPPRPAKATAPLPSTKRAAAAPASRPAATAKKPATSRPAFEPPTLISSSEAEGDEEGERSDADRDELIEDAPDRADRHDRAPPQPSVRPVSAELLSRLLYHNFEDDNTQIQRGAMKMVERYIDIFVQEAIVRARLEREDAAKGGGISDGFLQVEDLEKLTPQLVLDF